MSKFPLAAVITLVIIIVILCTLWSAVFAGEKPYIRPMIKGATEFRVIRNKIQSTNFYECADASRDLWKTLDFRYSEKDKQGLAIVILDDVTQRVAKGEARTTHAVVYFSGLYLDPTKDKTFRRIPHKYKEIERLNNWADIEISHYLK